MKPTVASIHPLPALSDAVQYPFRNRVFFSVFSRTVLYVVLGVLLTLGSGMVLSGDRWNLLVMLVLFLVQIPFVAYAVQIIQASMVGSEQPPAQHGALTQLRVAIEVSVLWAVFLLASDIVISYLTIYLVGDFEPVVASVGGLIPVNLVPLPDTQRGLIVGFARQIGVFYALPIVFASYSQRERLGDLLPLTRIRDVLLTRNYVRLGLISVVTFGGFHVVGYLLANVVLRGIAEQDQLILLGLLNGWPSGFVQILVISVTFLAIPVILIISFLFPLAIVARVTGSYWHTIETSRGDRKLLVDTTTQVELARFNARK